MGYQRMDRGTPEDYALDEAAQRIWLSGVADAALGQLLLLRGDAAGAAVDRYEHSLQAATRALRDDAGDELVVAALLHDIGDQLAPANHAQLAADILRPYVSDETWWVVRHHDIFQGYYFFHHIGGDRDARDRHRNHPHYKSCVRFCDRWDMRSFDPDYDSESLETFLPLVRALFARKPGEVFD